MIIAITWRREREKGYKEAAHIALLSLEDAKLRQMFWLKNPRNLERKIREDSAAERNNLEDWM